MGKNTIPKNWPTTITYLPQPSYAPHITQSQHQVIRTRVPDLTAEVPRNLPRGPSALVKIFPIANPSHPANGQSGLFAARNLLPGAFILPYYGSVHSSLPPHCAIHEKSDYDLWLDRDAELAVDAEKAGNEARFINDFRGVGDQPNSEFRETWDPRRGERCMAVFVLPSSKKQAAGGIKKGDEILVSYGKGFWSKRKHEGLSNGVLDGPSEPYIRNVSPDSEPIGFS